MSVAYYSIEGIHVGYTKPVHNPRRDWEYNANIAARHDLVSGQYSLSSINVFVRNARIYIRMCYNLTPSGGPRPYLEPLT